MDKLNTFFFHVWKRRMRWGVFSCNMQLHHQVSLNSTHWTFKQACTLVSFEGKNQLFPKAFAHLLYWLPGESSCKIICLSTIMPDLPNNSSCYIKLPSNCIMVKMNGVWPTLLVSLCCIAPSVHSVPSTSVWVWLTLLQVNLCHVKMSRPDEPWWQCESVNYAATLIMK